MKTLYSIEGAETSYELSEAVNLRLKFGWKLQGGVCVIFDGIKKSFYQSLYNDDFIENKS